MPYTYDYPRPALTVDCVVFGLDEGRLKVLLIQRAREPFAGRWALPGGFVEIDEELEETAARELQEETGLSNVSLEQLHTFGAVDRDPRGRTVSVVYWGLVRVSQHRARGGSDASQAGWFDAARLPRLAFDHREVVAVACQRLRSEAVRRPLGLEALPARFPWSEWLQLYETILGQKLDRRRLLRQLLDCGLLVETPSARRAAGPGGGLYRFDKRTYRRLRKEGFPFLLAGPTSRKRPGGH